MCFGYNTLNACGYSLLLLFILCFMCIHVRARIHSPQIRTCIAAEEKKGCRNRDRRVSGRTGKDEGGADTGD